MLKATKNDALILIDIQNDFLPAGAGQPDGALAVPGGREIIPAVAQLARAFDHIILTQDWHPAGHASFASSHEGRAPFSQIEMPYGNQVLWPDHCVQASVGAALALPDEIVDKAELIIRKGTNRLIDSYSAFVENDQETPTGLFGYLAERNVSRVVFAGLALDYCVAWSAIDAARLGLEAVVIEDACRGIARETVVGQKQAMEAEGVALRTMLAYA